MPFYLSEYVGSGTRANPFRVVGADQPGSSSIDLRPDPSLVGGGGLNAALLHTQVAFADARARFLADDKLEGLTNPQRNFLQNRLGVDLSSPTLLRDIVAVLLSNPPVNGWKALKPGRLRWEIWLGGLLWEAPRAAGGATDDFNRADETPVAAPWTQQSGSGTTFNLASNALVLVSAANAIYYYAGAASTADQYSECTNVGAGGKFAGPSVRVGSDGFSGYNLEAAFNQLSKFVSGSLTLIGSGLSPTILTGHVMRVEASGSSIHALYDGSEMTVSPVTDTSLTTAGNGVGVLMGETGAPMDNWSGGDLGGPPQTLRPDADIVTTGWATAPLFSKINETSADGTVITATAS